MSDRTPDEVEQEVVAQRYAIEETLDALRDKLSSGQILGTLARTFAGASGQGGELVANLGRQLRDNPLPVVFTGISLAWLLTSQNAPARSAARAGEGEGRTAPATLKPYDRERYEADADAEGVETAVAALLEGRYDLAEAEDEEDTRRLDHAQIAADDAAHGADHVLRRLREGAYVIEAPRKQHVFDRAALAADRAIFGATHVDETLRSGGYAGPGRTGSVERVGEAVSGSMERAGDAVADLANDAAQAGGRMRRRVETFIADEPVVASVVGLALGVALGAALLPRRRTRGESLPSAATRAGNGGNSHQTK